MSRSSMAVLIFLGGVSLLSLGMILKNQLMNPMEFRKLELDREINFLAAKPMDEVLTPAVNYRQLKKELSSHPRLWRELVPPPPPKKVAPKGPDFVKLLTGVRASKRQVKVGNTIKVRMTTPDKPRGVYKVIGDVINGVKIKEFTPTHVVFEKPLNGKTFTYELLRN